MARPKGRTPTPIPEDALEDVERLSKLEREIDAAKENLSELTARRAEALRALRRRGVPASALAAATGLTDRCVRIYLAAAK